jgi:hypothetical protein
MRALADRERIERFRDALGREARRDVRVYWVGGNFMQDLFRQGALQGRTPQEGYVVKCDATTTTQADIDGGVVNVLVGFAPLKPAEFVVILIQQLAGKIPP